MLLYVCMVAAVVEGLPIRVRALMVIVNLMKRPVEHDNHPVLPYDKEYRHRTPPGPSRVTR